ncbi:sushi, von Willebrand factor type A, EGF and pentraxin domain-containing protein 1-like [Acanthaster planci]|uniref:Sushi, von Willebrand factor type A, EGF and pentraxin domain-containing protein 1-like n=1 Tax=Acanthaster planci TaxID=133434 RepID=A0A8B7ZZD2_ACAPL|nr:sushi, von Willebrand factor type A, EGF and pentraxin domain-containing protein 1-like [Acanthaster planci]
MVVGIAHAVLKLVGPLGHYVKSGAHGKLISQPGFEMEAKTSLCASAVLLWMLLFLPGSDACRGGRGGGGSPCRQPPTLVPGTCPRRTIIEYAGPLSSTAVVRWSEPRAETKHSHCDPARVEREDGGPPNGGYFNANLSPYYVKYSATDAKDNRQPYLCSFIVTVRIKRCGHHRPVTWGSVSCSHQDRYGSECTVTCLSGYSIQGSHKRTCQANRMWSGLQPRCTPIQCPTLPGTSCTDSNYYRSICTHSCSRAGYGLAPGQSAIRVCRADRTWTGITATCVDKQAPTLNCPGDIRVIADASQTYKSVTWDLPQVSDNSELPINPELAHGSPPPGSMLSRGSHSITYRATDEAGNTATCSFTVIVQVIQCPALQFPSGQRMMCSPSQFIYGSVCQFECQPGFVLTGNASIECQREGNIGVWRPEQPTCEAITCPPLTAPENGRIVGNTPCSTAYGSWCQFECDDGYQLTGSGVRRCLAVAGAAEGYWDGYDTSCEEQTCPRVYIPPNAYITNQDECPATDQIPAGTTCRFACRPGHALTGSTEVSCGTDGNWDTTFPYCEVITCDSSELPAPQNGIKNGCPHAEELYGTVCTLICDLGFMPTQPTYVTCVDDGNGGGTWDKNTITCEAVKCDPLDVPSSPGYMPLSCTLSGVTVNDTDQMQSFGTICVAACDLGFTSSGSGSRTCQLNGQWDGVPLQCIDITPPTLMCPSDITLFAIQGTSFAEVGYEWEPIPVMDASGDIIATLTSINGQPVPANRSSIFHEGTYRLIYSAMDVSGNEAGCDLTVNVIVARCPPLYGPQNSETSLVSGQGTCHNSAVYGSVCSISCDAGYTPSDGSQEVTVECVKNTASSTVGYWQGSAVECVPNMCQVPTIPNGYISGCSEQEVEFQSSCAFVCSLGYRDNRTSLSRTIRTCLADGHWTGVQLVCEAVVCPTLPSLDHGTVQPSECFTQHELPYNTQCMFTCNEGFSLNGPYSKVCTAQGVWSDARPVSCSDHQPPAFIGTCPMYISAVAPPNMRQTVVYFTTPDATDNSGGVTVTRQNPSLGSGSSFVEGTTRVVYIATDAAMNRRQCDVYVTVQVQRCRPLQAPASGSLVQCPSNIYGATCSFACNEGHDLIGDRNRMCERVNTTWANQISGSDNFQVEWTGESPTCSPVTCPALYDRLPAIRSGCFQYPPATELLGTTCNWYCPYGYGGVGSPRSMCLANSTWDVVDFSCEERSCPPLDPPAGMEISPPNCLNSPTFNDDCFLQCSQSGYKVDPPSYDFIRCRGNGEWSRDISAATCVDYEDPHFILCPLDFIEYPLQGASEATVTWNVMATDNSGETPSVNCSIQQPAVLAVGEHPIRCTATDDAGNQAFCDFEVQVKVRRCRQLNPPFYGDFVSECDSSHGSTCQVRCQNGYTLRGSDTATCSRNASTGLMYWDWNGRRPTCQIASCPPLPDDLIPVEGGVYPSFCRGPIPPYYGTTCHFYCRNGFTLVGPADHQRLTCLSDGAWDQNLYTLNVQCQDNVPPTLRVCPGSLSGSMSGQTLGVVLSFDVPMAVDNSGAQLTLIKTPPDIDSPYNFTQDTDVSYIFTDPGGNSVSCNFSVSIQDNLSPVLDFCPPSQDITANQTLTPITWPEPVFRELTGDVLEVSCSHQNGLSVPWGSYNIWCSATNLDNGKTAMCQFRVTVTPLPCAPLAPPRHGAKACDSWIYGRFCSMFCNANYDTPPHTNPLHTFLFCGQSGLWAPVRRFPDCAVRSRFGQMNLPSTLHYFSGDCSSSDAQAQIRQQFIWILGNHTADDIRTICTQNAAECHVGNVQVTCGSARRRRDVSIWQDSALGFGPGLNQLNASLPETEADEFAEHAQKWLSHMREKGKLPPNRHGNQRRRLPAPRPKPNTEWTRSRRSAMSYSFTVSFSLEYVLPSNSTMSDLEFKNESWNGYDRLYDLVDSIQVMADSGSLELAVDGMEIDPQPVLEYAEPTPSCPHGYMATYSMTTYSLTCVTCPVGQFFNNDTLICEECLIGRYQDEDQEPQFTCKFCPVGTSTVGIGSTNLTDCLGVCPSGHFSDTGLEPCFRCEKGSYQSEARSLSCLPCPVGQSTASIGYVCPAGSFSASGVQPCTPCPHHSYQPNQGQSSCQPCPDRHITQVTGATDLSMCSVQTFCSATSCLNGGTCMEQLESFLCECPAGLTGEHCQTDVIDCQQDSCFNGGTCVDELNGFSCTCAAGYQGSRCEGHTDLCNPNPCHHNAVCEAEGEDYYCVCPAGLSGRDCEIQVDVCHEGETCLNGGSCAPPSMDQVCLCVAGFVVRGGTCINGLNMYSCDCPPGYSGPECEQDINECDSHLCQNGAQCIDGVNQYLCRCRPGFVGTYCSQQAQSNFDMVFRGSHPSQYITLPRAIGEPLHAFTIMMWIRTAIADGLILAYTTQSSGQTLDDAQFAISNPGALRVYIQGYHFFSSVSVNDDHWHHLAISWDEHGGILKIYRDGQLRLIHTSMRSGARIHSGGEFTLGELRNSNDTQSQGFTGSLSSVNLWDTALNTSVVQQHAQTCGFVAPGSVIAAADFMDTILQGHIQIVTPSKCDLVDDCASNPCASGSTCIDDVNQFICQCPLGFTGQRCQTNIDDCGTDSSPCDNGGTCVDGIGNFTCQCPLGFSGQVCELRRGCRNVSNPFRGNLVCQIDGQEQNCTISCWQGYSFSRAVLPFYQCSPSTNYKWSHETEDNPRLALPQCTKYKPPNKVAMEMNLEYSTNLTCDGVDPARDNLVYQTVRDKITSNVQMLSCVQDNSCTERPPWVSGCSTLSPADQTHRRHHRSVEPIQITIRLERDIHVPDQQNLTSEQVTSHNSTLEAVSALQDAALLLINQSLSEQFAVNIDSQVYDIDSQKTQTYGMQVCPHGSVRMSPEDARCVPCESGWYHYQEACYACPPGMYQSQEGSTYCQACPRGHTTVGPGARGEEDCEVTTL